MGDESLRSFLKGSLTSRSVLVPPIPTRGITKNSDMYYLRYYWSTEFFLAWGLLTSIEPKRKPLTLSVEHRISSGMGEESLRSLLKGLLSSKNVIFTLSMEHRISSGMGDESLKS